MGRIKEQDKKNIKALLGEGMSQRNISFRLKIPKTTVARHSKNFNFKSNDKGGRPKLLSERDENFCIKQMTTGKCATAVLLSKEFKKRFDVTVSAKTISRSMKKKGLNRLKRKRNLSFH